MNKIYPILSIIVISHEQREELRRCLESILAMELPFPYEIIVSDDRSTDGSFELAQDYEQKCVNGRLAVDYTDINVSNLSRILALQCNSDEGNCANNSQRSGYNRCNAYLHARGKYIAHVDADDYFRPRAMVYEKQIEALELHPECSLAMSTCLSIDEPLTLNPSPLKRKGTLKDWREVDLSQGKPWPFPRKMTDGEVIEQRVFVRGDWFRLNQCFMQRRNPNVDPVTLYGNRYVDSVITYHHLQFGKVVYVEACDYVYVRTGGSVTKTLGAQNHDADILWNLGLYIPALIPMWTCDFYMGTYYQPIRNTIKMALSNYQLSITNYQSLKEMHLWIYDCFGRELNGLDRLRLRFTDTWMKMMKKTGWESALFVNILNVLLTK